MQEELNLTVFNPILALIAEVQQQDALMEPDYTTPEGEKELRSYVRTIRGHRSSLEKVRVLAKSNALEYGRAVDAKAKELKAPFDEIIDARMKPLDEIEEAKRKAAEAIVEAERVAAEQAEADRLADLKRREAVVAEQEAKVKAQQAAIYAQDREADQAAREKRIAAEAAETATKQAEANARFESERKERIERDKQRLADQAKALADEAERKRVANHNHRNKVEREVAGHFVAIVKSEELAAKIVAAIKTGKIPNVTIKY